MGSFTVEVLPTKGMLRIVSLPADKHGSVTVYIENSGDPNVPETKNLRPLFLVSCKVPKIEDDGRIAYHVPDDCSHIVLEITDNRASGSLRTYYKGIRVIAKRPNGNDVWHHDAGLKKNG